MTRKSTKGIFGKAMDAQATDPVIENSKLPRMEAVDSKQAAPLPKQAKNALIMGAAKEGDAKATKKDIQAGKAMGAFDPKEKVKMSPPVGDMKPKATRKTAGDFYLVFRMHVQNGEMTVEACKRVDSELLREEGIVQGGLTYEATLLEQRLSIASVPDFGEQRSFPHPEDKARAGHHISILPSFDFNVRIPGDAITEKDLPKVKVLLYRFKEHVPDLKLNSSPLHMQFEKETRVVAELDGITADKMDKAVRAQVKAAFGK
ncbi:hypothetical protein [Paraflavitalea sp. CAU 1676]|uniref:hypothetical protein n=1 Tax=Paraflavitalea sp. CAU 1676 TaxID=3032598 RepID=UPI0023DC9FF8|nr:hypothetical protein [Paraflavitalea sp. CAU 1676]MDF2189033.1 hypothetical protein [Paraflavitalea sp. CAU 1676]